jgi:nicotinamide-nucleotide amidase
LGIIKAHILKAAGIGESTLDSMIGDELLNRANPSIGLAAHHGIIDVRITAKASSEAEADVMIAAMETEIREKIGEFIYGVNDEKLEAVLLNLTYKHGLRLAVVEAGIQNAIIEKLKKVDKDAVHYNVVAANPEDAKQELEIEGEGRSLRQLAETIAVRIAEWDRAAAGIAILSLPDVDERADVEEASAIAIYINETGEMKSRIYGFGGKNPITSEWLSTWAMAYVWRALKEKYEKLG